MMRLYLLRHGIAEEYRSSATDAERRLTEAGIRQMERQAEAMARLDLRLDAIVTSPYLRAAETAHIVGRALGMENAIETDARIASGFGLGALQQIVAARPHAASMMIVGHNPTLPMVAGQLAGGAMIEMKKGGLIRLDVDRVEPGGAVLEWIVTPAVMLGRESKS